MPSMVHHGHNNNIVFTHKTVRYISVIIFFFQWLFLRDCSLFMMGRGRKMKIYGKIFQGRLGVQAKCFAAHSTSHINFLRLLLENTIDIILDYRGKKYFDAHSVVLNYFWRPLSSSLHIKIFSEPPTFSHSCQAHNSYLSSKTTIVKRD